MRTFYDSDIRKRILILGLALAGWASVVAARLVQLQVFGGDAERAGQVHARLDGHVAQPDAARSAVTQHRLGDQARGVRKGQPLHGAQGLRAQRRLPVHRQQDRRDGHKERFSEEVLYSEDQRVSALSSYFELMDRLLPNFLGVITPQRIRGTRVLLR